MFGGLGDFVEVDRWNVIGDIGDFEVLRGKEEGVEDFAGVLLEHDGFGAISEVLWLFVESLFEL